MVPVHSPATILGTNICFCSGLPCTSSAAVAPMVEAAVHREHARCWPPLWNSVTTWLSVTGSPCRAMFRRRRPIAARPPSGELPVGAPLKPWRRRRRSRRHAACSPLEIAGAVERLRAPVRRALRLRPMIASRTSAEASVKHGQIVVAVDLEHVVEQEGDVFQRGLCRSAWCSPGRGDEVARALEIESRRGDPDAGPYPVTGDSRE